MGIHPFYEFDTPRALVLRGKHKNTLESSQTPAKITQVSRTDLPLTAVREKLGLSSPIANTEIN